MDRRDLQLAANEATFRNVNEIVLEAVIDRVRTQPIEFHCECSDEFCVESTPVSADEYERIRAHPDFFIIAPGHDRPEVERVVERKQRYWIVEKVGEAAEFAEETDPRRTDDRGQPS